MSTIHERLHAVRVERGSSLRAFAAAVEERAGYAISASSAAAYEKGRKVPAEYLRAVAFACGVDPAWLLTGEEPAPPENRQGTVRTSPRSAAGSPEPGSGRTRGNAHARAAEAELKKLSSALAQTGSTVVITDRAGRIEYVNRAFCEASGYREQELLGRTPALLKSGVQDAAFYRRLWQTIEAGGTFRGMFVNRRKHGELYHVLQTITPMAEEGAPITHYVATGKEITEQVALERERVRAQRLESLGTLAGGMAHDFNNLLTVILANLSLARSGLPSEAEEVQGELQAAEVAARRAAELTRQLLAISRRQVSRPLDLDLVRELADFEPVARSILPASVELQVGAAVDSARIRMDPDHLNQVLRNLATSAGESMPGGGRLSIRLDRAPRGPDRAAGKAAEGGAWLVLELSDSGAGMAPEDLERAFDPFHGARFTGGGSRLELPTVYGIVRQCGGSIEAQSAPGVGTTFRILLPEAPEPDA
jgi:two-component system, cell cycle sensor histidine kinase and response regulator CckA